MKSTPETKAFYQKFLQNNATAAELEALLKDFGTLNESDLRGLISDALNREDALAIADSARLQRLATLQAKINDSIDGGRKTFRLYTRPFFKIAATIVITGSIAFSGFLIFKNQDSDFTAFKAGGNLANLKLSDGRNLVLENVAQGTFAKAGSVSIEKKADGIIIYRANSSDTTGLSTINTIETPRGGQYKITLSDGTSVLLNAGSTLSFPIGFHGNTREVSLKGEAYFEVAKNPSKPFIVHTKTFSTTVLGTKFDLSTYTDDHVARAILLEGKIKVASNQSSASVILKPGQQASVNNYSLAVDTVNTENATAWKDGLFIYENESIDVVMHHISRWYDIDVDYNTLPQRQLYIKISRNQNLSELLRMISLTTNLKFQLTERRLSVIQ
ncbi:FecR family protein [Pedobacter sp. AW1-32]|uniref:FecR family protein n=1 Tax=Pedobacter sp. AW1-32 TaxID=3383026 RepID=UPI003FEDB212